MRLCRTASLELSVVAAAGQLILKMSSEYQTVDHWARHVNLCYHKFGQKNHTKTCRVRRYAGIPVIRSKKHGYEASGLGFHQNTMTLHTRASRHMKFRAHT